MPRWLVYCVLTVLAWGVWAVLFKALANVSAAQAQAFSTLGILPILLVLAESPGWRQGGDRRGAWLAFAAGVLVGVGNLAYYQAMAADVPATAISALTAPYPVVTVVLALVLLRERPHPVQWLGVVGSLVAVYLLSGGPAAGASSKWLLYALPPIVLWGGAALLMKVATRTATAERATFWFLIAFVPLAAVILALAPLLDPEPVRWALPVRAWLVLVLIGATYGLGNLTLLAAYHRGGPAAVVTPLAALYPVVTIPLALIFFGERVDGWQAAGIGLALAAAVALSFEPKAAPPERAS